MAVSKRLRFEILRRDNHACRYCGLHAPDIELRVDHVVPKALGGGDEPSNLVTACEPCNSGKTSIAPDQPLVEDVAADAVRWARAMKVAGELLAAETDAFNEYADKVLDQWDGWKYGYNGKTLPRPGDAKGQVGVFYRAGLPLSELLESVDIAARGPASPEKTWVYFCGVAWKKLHKMREMAADLLEKESIDNGE